MKFPLLLLLVIQSSHGIPPSEGPEREEFLRQVNQDREHQIQELAQEFHRSNQDATGLPPEKAIPLYGNALLRLGGWQRPDTLAVYEEAQQKLLSIPGHATYYRDKLKAGQAEVRAGRMRLADWRSLKMNSFQTLQHMPSEETVEVLAGFVDDRFADRTSDDPEDTNIPNLPPVTEVGDNTVNSAAANALEALGIEPPPYKDKTQLRFGEYKTLWSQWWKEVKAGKRKYRFKGSGVEHPVNAPPGTGREIHRPGREAVQSSGTRSAENPAPAETRNEPGKPKGPKWPVIAGLIAALAAAMLYLQKKTDKQ